LRWYPNDWLILAGDIGEVGEHLDFALSMTTRRFARVMEVPGNHDLWSVGSDREFRGQSKYDYLGSICRVYGVLTPKDPYVRWPGDCTKIERTFRDGHTETWWAADLRFGSYGPSKALRVSVATTDPATLPGLTTWYLSTNLPHPDAPGAADSLLAPADLAEIVRLYGLRNWVEQGYRQVKQELGWTDFMVRSDRAIRRHWELVCCAFAFCWRDWFHPHAPPDRPPADRQLDQTKEPTDLAETAAGRGKNQHHSRRSPDPALLAACLAPRPGLARSLDVPAPLLARLVRSAPALRTPSARQLGR